MSVVRGPGGPNLMLLGSAAGTATVSGVVLSETARAAVGGTAESSLVISRSAVPRAIAALPVSDGPVFRNFPDIAQAARAAQHAGNIEGAFHIIESFLSYHVEDKNFLTTVHACFQLAMEIGRETNHRAYAAECRIVALLGRFDDYGLAVTWLEHIARNPHHVIAGVVSEVYSVVVETHASLLEYTLPVRAHFSRGGEAHVLGYLAVCIRSYTEAQSSGGNESDDNRQLRDACSVYALRLAEATKHAYYRVECHIAESLLTVGDMSRALVFLNGTEKSPIHCVQGRLVNADVSERLASIYEKFNMTAKADQLRRQAPENAAWLEYARDTVDFDTVIAALTPDPQFQSVKIAVATEVLKKMNIKNGPRFVRLEQTLVSLVQNGFMENVVLALTGMYCVPAACHEPVYQQLALDAYPQVNEAVKAVKLAKEEAVQAALVLAGQIEVDEQAESLHIVDDDEEFAEVDEVVVPLGVRYLRNLPPRPPKK